MNKNQANDVIAELNKEEYKYKIENINILSGGNDVFIGRDDLISKIVSKLDRSENDSGCFLVGGYRGVGKSTTVKRAINRYIASKEKARSETNNRIPHIVVHNINLGDDGVKNKADFIKELVDGVSTKLCRILPHYDKHLFTSLLIQTIAITLWINREDIGVVTYSSYCLFSIGIISSIIATILSINYANIKTISKINALRSALFYKLTDTYKVSFLSQFFGGAITSRRSTQPASFSIVQAELFEIFKRLQKTSHKIKLHKCDCHGDAIDQYKIDGIVNKKRGLNTPNRRNNKNYKFSLEDLYGFMVSTFFRHRKTRKSGIGIIFVFDELDKLGRSTKYNGEAVSNEESLNTQELLLSEMKTLLTSALARFFFISDRALIDRYNSDSVTKNSLYDSIFNDVFYVPSLLTDHSGGKNPALHRKIEFYVMCILDGDIIPDKCRDSGLLIDDFQSYSSGDECYKKICQNGNIGFDVNKYYILKRYIEYLTLYSWGVVRRINSLIEQNIKREGDGNYIVLKSKDIKSIIFSSKIYQSIDLSYSNHLSRSDDKHLVSTIVSIHEVIRFHSLPFSQQYFDRSMEGIETHSDPNIHNTIRRVLDGVLSLYIRKVHNGIYGYRFYSAIQEEIKEITRLLGADASILMFGHDATANVVDYFLGKIESISKHDIDPTNAIQHKAVIFSTVADLYFWEASYDLAITYYTSAAAAFKRILRHPVTSDVRRTGLPSFSAQYLLVRVLLKCGLVEEKRGSSELANKYYRSAAEVAMEYLSPLTLKDIRDDGNRHTEIRKLGTASSLVNDDPLLINNELIKDSLRQYWKKSSEEYNYRESLILSALAIDSVSLKMGVQGRKDVKETLPSLEEMYFDENNTCLSYKDRKNANLDLLFKALSIRLAANETRVILDTTFPLVDYALIKMLEGEEELYLNYAECKLLVLFGQASIVNAVENMTNNAGMDKSTWRKTYKKLCEHIGFHVDLGEKYCGINLHSGSGKRHVLSIKEKRHMLIKDTSNNSDRNFFERVSLAIFIMSIASDRIFDLGYRTRSSYIYMNILSIWTYFVENSSKIDLKFSQGETQIEPHELKDKSTAKVNSAQKFYANLISRIYKHTKYIDRVDLHTKRLEWLRSDWSMILGSKEVIDNRYTSQYFNCLFSEAVLTNGDEFHTNYVDWISHSFAFWHRSHIEMSAMMFHMWSSFAMYDNQGASSWNASSPCEDIERNVYDKKSFGRYIATPRDRVIYYWISGRAKKRKAETIYESLVDNDDNLSKKISYIDRLVCSAFKDFVVAMSNYESSSISGFLPGQPLRPMILYNIYRLLEFDRSIKNVSRYNDGLYIGIKNGDKGDDGDVLSRHYRIPRSYFEINEVEALTAIEYTETSHFRNRDSIQYKEMLKNKFFLNDDYDDPMFKIDWIAMRLWSLSARLYPRNMGESSRSKTG